MWTLISKPLHKEALASAHPSRAGKGHRDWAAHSQACPLHKTSTAVHGSIKYLKLYRGVTKLCFAYFSFFGTGLSVAYTGLELVANLLPQTCELGL